MHFPSFLLSANLIPMKEFGGTHEYILPLATQLPLVGCPRRMVVGTLIVAFAFALPVNRKG